jgi:hypothetical protein
MYIENFQAVGEWLGERLSPTADDITRDEASKMKKDELVDAVMELQSQVASLKKELAD